MSPGYNPADPSPESVDVATHPHRSSTIRPEGSTPTPEEVRAAREAAGLTQEQAGAYVYAPWHTWQKWETAADMENNRRMHPSSWELFRVKVAARALLEKGALDLKTLKRLGLQLPDLDE